MMNKASQSKKRTYTVQQREGVPCLTLRGKWLNTFGIDVGNQLQLIKSKNMLVLMKVPEAVTERNHTLRQLAVLEEQAEYLRSAL